MLYNETRVTEYTIRVRPQFFLMTINEFKTRSFHESLIYLEFTNKSPRRILLFHVRSQHVHREIRLNSQNIRNTIIYDNQAWRNEYLKNLKVKYKTDGIYI